MNLMMIVELKSDKKADKNTLQMTLFWYISEQKKLKSSKMSFVQLLLSVNSHFNALITIKRITFEKRTWST